MGITVEKRKLKGKRMALYLNFSFGYRRWRESLHLILDDPINTEVRRLNREKMKLALTIRSKRELEMASNSYEIRAQKRDMCVNWFDISQTYLEQYQGKDIKMLKGSYAYLYRYVGQKALYLWQLDKSFCQHFYEYLAANLSGHTPVGYFSKFKQSLDYGVELRLLSHNPASGVRMVRQTEFTKSILTPDEICRLAVTPCIHHEVKRAFLFACQTGLRWCDIVTLRSDSVDSANRMLHLIQQKVKNHSSKAILHLALNKTALHLLRMLPPSSDGMIFSLPSYSYSSRVLKQWVRCAGIQKHITFHCARHSFVTTLLINGANIKTVSELAGHSTIRHTERYIHIVDELKRKAVDTLPDFRIDIE